MGEKDNGVRGEEPKLGEEELTEQAAGLLEAFKTAFPGVVASSPRSLFFSPEDISANYEARYLQEGTKESFFARRVPTNDAALRRERREWVDVVVSGDGNVPPRVAYERIRQNPPEDRLDKHDDTATAVEKVRVFLNGIPKEAHNT